MRDYTKTALAKMTKAELLAVITEVAESAPNADYFIARVADRLWHERKMARIDKEAKELDRFVALNKEYNELIRPYAGCRIADIPEDVLQRGAELERQIKAARPKWSK